jgi:ADP-ribosyl-[dinitrogen reductase] hydrolase
VTEPALDRALGALIGLAVGDALGAPVEFCSRGSFEPVTGMRSGGVFKLPAGAWTDDTAMALCLADSLLAAPELDHQDLLDRFCDWAANGANTSTGVCVGIGQNTLRVLGNYHRTGALRAPETRQKSDGNGALMRLAPVPVRHWGDRAVVRRVAGEQSRTTHYSNISAGACELTALILADLIAGRTWREALLVPQDPSWPDIVKGLDPAADWRARPRASISSSGFVIHTLEAALWAVDTTSSFEEAVLRAVNLGDDADSVGAVTGQLAGARYGLGSVPADWRQELVDARKIEEIGRALFAAGNA